MKKVLVIGSGGREHAIVYQLSRSAQVEHIYCAPGNAGIAQLAQCVAIADTDVEQLLSFAKAQQIDLCVVGPEAALAAGVADAFREAGIPVFGHTKAATQIEASKEFAKELMARYNVPTAAYRSFADYEQAMQIDYLKDLNDKYEDFIFRKYEGRVLVIESDGMDFENNPEDFRKVIDRIDAELFGLFSAENWKK